MTLEHEKPLESSYPSFSIIIEWENMLLYDSYRSNKMLEILANQLLEVSSKMSTKPEIIIVYNNEDINGSEIEPLIKKKLNPCSSIIDLKIIPSPGLHYYQQKNFGANHCNGDVIIFLDCDVIPNEGWLKGMLECFLQPEIRVVGGESYISSDTFLEKAFSIFWFMSPPSEKGPIYEDTKFLCNNMAFRNDTFFKNQFPTLPRYRGSCLALGESLQRKNIKIYRQPAARVAHSIPKGMKNIAIRAICQGHDVAVKRKKSYNVIDSQIKKNKPWRRIIKEQITKIRTNSRKLHLTLFEKIGVFGVISFYFSLIFIGIIIASINPEIIRKNFTV